MKQSAIVEKQFGNTAATYLTSSVHATGADLDRVRHIAAPIPAADILDLGCGAGHISFAVAPLVSSVIAYDLSEKMLEVVANEALRRKLPNIRTRQGHAEQLPFPDNTFDLVITRFSAHHWADVPAALKDIRRVLRPDGLAVVIDIIAPENPLHDTTLQAIELLRDASHVRDYRASEWAGMFAATGFSQERHDSWRLKMEFDEWVARMRTPPERITAIRSLLDSAPIETSSYFCVQDDYSFTMDAAIFEIKKASF